jgi:hypothetical protein
MVFTSDNIFKLEYYVFIGKRRLILGIDSLYHAFKLTAKFTIYTLNCILHLMNYES